MTTPISETRVSPLRQRLIDDMNMRHFSMATQRNYIRDIGRFATFLGRSPETATCWPSPELFVMVPRALVLRTDAGRQLLLKGKPCFWTKVAFVAMRSPGCMAKPVACPKRWGCQSPKSLAPGNGPSGLRFRC